MNRMEFIRHLAMNLSDLSESEREEAVQYYEDYLNDAGIENEQEVMEELGSPEKVAASIKAGLNGGNEGEFTEQGYHTDHNSFAQQSAVAEKNSPQQSGSGQQQSGNGPIPQVKTSSDSSKIILIIIVCVLLSPVLIPLALAVFGVVFGLLMAFFGVVFGFLVAGVGTFVSGLICIVFGIVKLFSVPLAGAVLLGVGFLLFGIGLLLSALMVWICAKVVPPMCRGIVALCRKPFEKKGGTA